MHERRGIVSNPCALAIYNDIKADMEPSGHKIREEDGVYRLLIEAEHIMHLEGDARIR